MFLHDLIDTQRVIKNCKFKHRLEVLRLDIGYTWETLKRDVNHSYTYYKLGGKVTLKNLIQDVRYILS